jgi:hypothetical protein
MRVRVVYIDTVGKQTTVTHLDMKGTPEHGVLPEKTVSS